MNSKIVVIPPSNTHGTRVVNYDADYHELNNFLANFNLWGRGGEPKYHLDGGEEVWFEMSKEFYNIIQTSPFKLALERFGVEMEVR